MTNCPVCLDKFNNGINVPRIFQQCGHSICEECLREIIKQSKIDELGQILIKCCVCNNITKSSEELSTIIQRFPKNFLALEIINNSKSNYSTNNIGQCQHIEKNKKFVCLNPQCQNKHKCCQYCLIKFHKECPENMIIDTKNFQAKVKIINPEWEINEWESNIKKIIAERLQIFTERWKSIVEIVSKLLRSQINELQSFTVDNLQEKQWALNTEYNEKDKVITVRLKSLNTLELLKDDIKDCFESIRIDSILRKMEQIYITPFLNEFQNLSYKEPPSYLEKYKKIIQCDISSESEDIDLSYSIQKQMQTIDDYAQDVIQYYKDVVKNGQDKLFYIDTNLDELTKTYLYQKCQKAIQRYFNKQEINQYLEKSMEKKFSKQNKYWKCVTGSNFNILFEKRFECLYAEIEANGFYITLFTQSI